MSLVHQELLSQVQGTTSVEAPRPLRLVTASGDQLPIKGHVRGTIQLGELEFTHTFVVVPKLVAPVILGVDFLHANGLVLDFTQTPVRVCHANACLVTPPGDTTAGMTEDTEYSVPSFQRSADVQLPECPKASFLAIVEEYQDLFWTNPGLTDQACHFIPTTGNPVRVPPCRIPAQYRKEVDKQLEEMLQLGIITESNSPWMAPAVYVRKKSGELRMCIDYRELTDGRRSKVVHINRVRHRILPSTREVDSTEHPMASWHPPAIDQLVLPPPCPLPRRYPERDRRPPDRFGSSGTSFH